MSIIVVAVTGLVLLVGHMTCAVLRSRAYRRAAERRIRMEAVRLWTRMERDVDEARLEAGE